jgi:hypothetical protein
VAPSSLNSLWFAYQDEQGSTVVQQPIALQRSSRLIRLVADFRLFYYSHGDLSVYISLVGWCLGLSTLEMILWPKSVPLVADYSLT